MALGQPRPPRAALKPHAPHAAGTRAPAMGGAAAGSSSSSLGAASAAAPGRGAIQPYLLTPPPPPRAAHPPQARPAAAQNSTVQFPAPVNKCLGTGLFSANTNQFCCALRSWATRRNQNQCAPWAVRWAGAAAGGRPATAGSRGRQSGCLSCPPRS
jgi:hypothetical protein